jgi:LuxR family maltose regulon positive regulatory protein
MGDLLDVLVLRAMALQADGNPAAALSVLEQALRFAEPEGYVRTFADEGAPMAALLEQAAGRTSPVASYAATLLASIPGARSAPPGAVLPVSQHDAAGDQAAQLLVEPLTTRELEILALIAAGHSNQAIADTLIVAVSTVKKHVNNIFGKLAVESRTQALIRARELSLL